MTRGTTPVHTFTLPISGINIAVLNIAYAQIGEVVLEKTLNDCELTYAEDSTQVDVPLSEEDTLKFKPGLVSIQIRLGDSNGHRVASNIIRISAKKILKDGVL